MRWRIPGGTEAELLVQLGKENKELYRDSLRRAVDALLSLQNDDGHFCGELQGDSILQSEYLLMKFILGQEDQPMADGRPGRKTLEKITTYLRSQQCADGSWGQYPGAGVDLSGTVKAYFALKLMGDDAFDEHMIKARQIVLENGGAERCNSFSNFYLACLGQISFNAVPAIPPEIILLPHWFYFAMNKVSAWTRTMILPLAIVTSLRPIRKLPKHLGIDELYCSQQERHRFTMALAETAPPAWTAFFKFVDRVLKLAQRVGATPLHRLALKQAEQWIVKRAGQDGVTATSGLGAIFPPMVYIQVALKALGYERDHPVIKRAERELDEFFIEDGDEIRIQPCFSPVWDTGIALYALTDCGLDASNPSIANAAKWLLEKECKHRGDWKDNVGQFVKSAGWFFEYENAWYADVDDTVMVAMGLKRAGGFANLKAAKRGVRWSLALQNDDGGWAAFDKTKNHHVLEYIPFADHNAIQDPSCPDITGRALECLSWHGMTIDDPPVQRAIEYIKKQQHPEGCFFGRWGVNYIYGTWQAVIGPIRCGEDRDQPWLKKAGQWTKSVQKEDGSFGESANSYIDPTMKGRGPATASQTAWGAMILQEIFGEDDPDLKRAIDWLVKTQLTTEQAANAQLNPDKDPPGSWHEPWFTGTGFPKVFYLRYHLYRLYFPVMAIGRYLSAHGISLEEKPHEQHTRDPAIKLLPKVMMNV